MLQVEFRVGSSVPPDLHIRAMPVYSEAAHFREPVRRCPNHASAADPTNTNFPHPRHLVRVDTETSRYEEDEASGRLSVIFPVQPPHEVSSNFLLIIELRTNDEPSRNFKFHNHGECPY